jgi:integrase
MSVTEPIREAEKIAAITDYFLKKHEYRNYLLVVMGVNTALRISDMLRLRWRDVYDFEKAELKNNMVLTEKKTGKQKIVALNNSVKYALRLNLGNNDVQPAAPLFPRAWDRSSPISRVWAYMIIRDAGNCFGINISCHSLRKTFGYYAMRNGVALPVLMEIYNHSSAGMTLKYLGVTQDDQNKVYNDMEKFLPICPKK